MKRKLILSFSVLALGVVMIGCGKKSGTAVTGEEGIIRLAMKDDNSSNPNTAKYFNRLNELLAEEGIKATVEVVDLPSEGYEEKLNLQISSGDIPDIMYFQGGDANAASQDLLEDLRPYVKSSTYLKKIIGVQSEKRLENYPYLVYAAPLTAPTPVIKKDIFEQTKTGEALLKEPTLVNYEAFFKELIGLKDSEGNGAKYAITTSGDIKELDNIFNMAFGNTLTWLPTSAGFEYYKVSDNEKKKIEFYRHLYAEGLIDPQFLTKKWDTKENAFYDGEAGVISGTSGKVIDMYNSKVEQLNQTELLVLPPAKGVSQGYGATDISKEKRGFAISSQSVNKELAFEVLDFLASPKGQLLDQFGFEGEQYNIVDNKIELTPESAQWYQRFWYPVEPDLEMELVKPAMSDVGYQSLASVEDYYTEDNLFVIPEELVSKWDAAENIYNEYIADIITGKKEMTDFDKFVTEWKKSGGDELTAYANEHIK